MKNPLFALYEKLPISLQNFAMSVYGLKLYKERYGSAYNDMLSILAKLDYSDKNEMERLQEQRFLDFVSYTYQTSAFYQEFYKNIDMKREILPGVSDIGVKITKNDQ